MSERKVVDGYVQAFVDVDGDWVGIQRLADDDILLQTTSDASDRAVVRIRKGELPQFFRDIAEIAGAEILILAKPKAFLPPPRKLNVSANPAVSAKIQLDHGFSYTERLSPSQVARLIWDLAIITTTAQTGGDDGARRDLANELALCANFGIETTAIAREVIKLGYRKDASKVVEEGVHAFNKMKEITG